MGCVVINVTFTGNIFHEDGTPALNVRYQGLFIKVNPSSSTSRWDVTRLPETNQYNLNLGDNSWLSQQAGYAAPGDKVLLCFWTPNTKLRDELGLVEWCFIEWILDNRDVYVQNIQLRGINNPNCLFDITPGFVGHSVTIDDMGSNDYHMWIYEGKEHRQSYLWGLHHIYDMNKFPAVPVSINWGDGYTNSYPLSASPFSHIYGVSGNYDINVELENISVLKCNSNFTTSVPYQVFNGLLWDIPTINISSTYTPSLSGDLTRIQGVNYYIDGILTHIDFAYNQDFNHTFTTPGNHIIRQCIKYNDGFINKIQCNDFVIELNTIANYVSSDYDCGLVFSDVSIYGRPPIIKYQWDVMEGSFLLAHVEGTTYQEWYYSWPYKGTFRVRMAITDSNNRTSSITKEFIVDNCPGAGSDVGGGGGGGGSPWVYAETKYIKTNEPMPVITIVNIDGMDDEDKNKKILILEIIE
jgi:hypothetical protein